MNTIKTYVFNNFKTLSIIWSFCFISMFLLMVRLKLTHSFFYLFLVWNLFLAMIPFAISTTIKNKKDLSNLFLIFSFSFWLLFLPNAPYIVTDLIHLRLSQPTILWYDFIMISAFALSGLLLFYYSISDMVLILKNRFNKKIQLLFIPSICFLSAFGIYLGRILRYNSWEIVSNPFQLIRDIV